MPAIVLGIAPIPESSRDLPPYGFGLMPGIADFIDYDAALPHMDLFISYVGYGSVLLSLNHGVPILAAGKHEGKNEIVARIGYFELGINLKTETPTISQLRSGAAKIWSDPGFKRRVGVLKDEFSQYDPYPLCETYIAEAIANFQSSAPMVLAPLSRAIM